MASTSFRKIWNTTSLKSKKDEKGGTKNMVFEGSIENFIENGSFVLEESISLFHGRTNPIRNFSVDELNAMNLEPHSLSFKESDVKWYKGFWDGRSVLVKEQSEKFDPKLKFGTFREIVVAAQMSSHRNVHKLLGCCLETKYTVLVFEWVENVNLYDLIFRDNNLTNIPPINWQGRLRIAWEISHALAYLHTAFYRPIIHRSLKPQNVFLGKDDAAKLSDFSLCISVPKGKDYIHEDLIVGTFGYIAPEYSSGRLTTSTDVYAFGMFFLVLLTGKRIILEDSEAETHLRKWVENSFGNKCTAEILDPAIAGDRLAENEEQEQKLRAAIELALRCTATDEDIRPTMVDVATELKSVIRSFEFIPESKI